MGISEKDIEAHFPDFERIGDTVFKFRDIVPALTFCYYFTPDRDGDRDLLVVSDGFEDDQFAQTILAEAKKLPFQPNELSKHSLCSKHPLGFTHLLVAPSSFHRYFCGRLDTQRSRLLLILPIHNCEFAGDESLNMFTEIRRRINSGLDWKRSEIPRILVKFNNPKTQGGGGEPSGIPVDFSLVEREIQNLNGVADGYISVINFRNETATIRSPGVNEFTFQTNGETHNWTQKDVGLKTWDFLTTDH